MYIWTIVMITLTTTTLGLTLLGMVFNRVPVIVWGLTGTGPEFTGRELDQWASALGIAHQFIGPGKPVQNAYLESFAGRMRDEFLNVHWFLNVSLARLSLAIWRRDDNSLWPHSLLGNLTSQQCARQMAG
ncbi:hypothetical protein GCM10008956_37420 [Deinococcus arenae]|uniref:Integrase catalytic domain-containing protein n=3 Tax=Deinococcus TaxID=1298 RepID=A0A8H9LAI2_9DEIO|nr:hypothetical protein GCM10008956_37420 [Deinococcus arenae]